MSRNVRRFRSLILTVVGILAINWVIAYAGNPPVYLNPPRPKASGVPVNPTYPKPKASGVPVNPTYPRPKTSGVPVNPTYPRP
jgi:hypothetical protein